MLYLKQIWVTVSVVCVLIVCAVIGVQAYFATEWLCTKAAVVWTCEQTEEKVTIIDGKNVVKQVLAVQEFVGARGTYVTPYTVSNAAYNEWLATSSDADKTIIEKWWASAKKDAIGDSVSVSVEGEVFASFDFGQLKDKDTIQVFDQNITITLNGPHILTTHVFEKRRMETQDQGYWLMLNNNKEIEQVARFDQDKHLVQEACNPEATFADGIRAKPIHEVAETSARDFLTTYMRTLYPNATVTVKFQNPSCQAPEE